MSNRRLLMGAGAFGLLMLLLAASCSVISAPSGGDPTPTAACREAVFSPANAPAGTNFFGDGRPLVGLPADQLQLHFVAAGSCDPFQLSIREMRWYPERYPDEAARFARQQQLAGDLDELTAATRNMVQVVKDSEWSTDDNWSGGYETLFAAHTADGWHAYKLTKSMSGQQILVQKTKGGRTFLWKVECLFQPVARLLPGIPSGPPAGRTPPPPSGGYTPPPGSTPPGTTVPTTAPKCTGSGTCGSPNEGPEQQPPQENNPTQVAPTPGYNPGGAEGTIEGQTNPGGASNPSPGGYNCGSATCAPGEGTSNPTGTGVTEPIGGGGGQEPTDR